MSTPIENSRLITRSIARDTATSVPPPTMETQVPNAEPASIRVGIWSNRALSLLVGHVGGGAKTSEDVYTYHHCRPGTRMGRQGGGGEPRSGVGQNLTKIHYEYTVYAWQIFAVGAKIFVGGGCAPASYGPAPQRYCYADIKFCCIFETKSDGVIVHDVNIVKHSNCNTVSYLANVYVQLTLFFQVVILSMLTSYITEPNMPFVSEKCNILS